MWSPIRLTRPGAKARTRTGGPYGRPGGAVGSAELTGQLELARIDVDADDATGAAARLVVGGVWIVAGLLSLTGALTYAELAAMMPRAGGEYVFIREP